MLACCQHVFVSVVCVRVCVCWYSGVVLWEVATLRFVVVVRCRADRSTVWTCSERGLVRGRNVCKSTRAYMCAHRDCLPFAYADHVHVWCRETRVPSAGALILLLSGQPISYFRSSSCMNTCIIVQYSAYLCYYAHARYRVTLIVGDGGPMVMVPAARGSGGGNVNGTCVPKWSGTENVNFCKQRVRERASTRYTNMQRVVMFSAGAAPCAMCTRLLTFRLTLCLAWSTRCAPNP